MRWWLTFASFAVAGACVGQEPYLSTPAPSADPGAPGYAEIFSRPADACCEEPAPCRRTCFESDRAFPDFIGYVSNPTRAIDPRALTQLMPIFAAVWVPEQGRVPAGDVQGYGPALSIALGERFSFGASQGGYAVSNFNRKRDGWINLGFYGQYALVRDVERQFIFTAGMQVLTPWLGSTDLNQGGSAPAKLAPYFSFAKGLGEFHVLGTFGYQFPTGSEVVSTRRFYGTLHFDRQFFGWFYPLVEFNGVWSERRIDAPQAEAVLGSYNFGVLDSAGRILTVAPGFNAVLIRNRLEVGAVYQTPIVSANDFRFHELLVKMVVRY